MKKYPARISASVEVMVSVSRRRGAHETIILAGVVEAVKPRPQPFPCLHTGVGGCVSGPSADELLQVS